jgi:hypothetical protein
MAEARSEIPKSVAVPVDDLVAKYGPYFFTSSLAWMFAMAIEAGDEKIGLWGVDMAASEEYGYQRAGCQYFAMLAKARGIEVGVPPESCLLRPPPLYGVSELDHDRIKLLARKRELEARLNQRQAEAQAAQNEAIFLKGALDDMNYIDSTWTTRARGGPTYCEPPVVPALVGFAPSEQALDTPAPPLETPAP